MSKTKNIDLPIKRVSGDTIKERLTENAYNRILPARYLKKNEQGDLIETQEELFKRVAKNIALGDVAYLDEKITAKEEDLREGLDEEKNPFDTETQEIEVTEDNIYKFSYETIYPKLSGQGKQKIDETVEKFTEIMEYLKFTPNSPTLMNAGDELQQLSACFVDSPEDDMGDIHQTVKEASKIFQSGGGVGYAFWRLRPYGDIVKSTGGIASGPITFMRTFDQLCETVAQGGTRRGAQMGIMKVDHPDIPFFIHAKNKDVSLAHSLRLNDPDDPTHTSFGDALEEARELIDEDGKIPNHLRNAAEGHLSNFNISVGVTDEFMKAVENDEKYTLYNPRTGDPHIATEETKELYGWFDLDEYVEVGEPLEVPAKEMWDRIAQGAWENGEPGVFYIDQANRKHSFDTEKNPDHEMLATNPCVTGDTLISTSQGLYTAKELAKQGRNTEIIVDSRRDEEKIKKASPVYKTGTKDVYKLETEEGYTFRLTSDHKVMTEDGWKKAKNLTQDDEIHIQNREGEWGHGGTLEEGQVLGWLVGDGQMKKSEERAVLHFYDKDTELAQEFVEKVNKIIREPKRAGDYKVGVQNIKRKEGHRNRLKAAEKRVKSTRLYELAQDYNLDQNKLQVPEKVFKSSKELAIGFLQGLLTADGSIQGNIEKGISIRLSSSNKKLLKQVQKLFINFGIYSKIYYERREEDTEELPDGRGGRKEYQIKAQHDLVISKENLQKFKEEIGFLRVDKNTNLEEKLSQYKRGPHKQKFTASVDSLEYDGVEDVYDLTEPDTHSFIANGIVVHNCGEQPLEEYEACNLGHINLSTIVDKNRELWSEYDFSSNSDLETKVEEFLNQAIDWEEFNYRIDSSTHFLDNVVTMSDFPIPKIEDTVSRLRKIGLGIMGLAQMYIQIGVQYGSEEANEVARQLMMHINHRSKHKSKELAEERGTFSEWEDSKYSEPTKYPDWFQKHVGEDPENWKDGYPIRNHNTTTIAPTGTTSMVGNTTGGCEPMYNVAYFKNVTQDVQGEDMLVEFDDYFLRVLKANNIDVDKVKNEAREKMEAGKFEGVDDLDSVPDEIKDLFVIASDLSGKEHAAIQCALQSGVDSAISKTCNFPNDASVDDIKEVYNYIYKNGGKGVTIYRDGSRSKQVLTTGSGNEVVDEDSALEKTKELIERGEIELEDVLKDLDVEISNGKNGGLIENTKQAESETDLVDKNDNLSSEKVSGTVEKSKGIVTPEDRPLVLSGQTYKVKAPASELQGNTNVYVTVNDKVGDPFEVFISVGKSGSFLESYTEAIGRLISLYLRSGGSAGEVIDQLKSIKSPEIAYDEIVTEGEEESQKRVFSVPDAIAKAIDYHIKTGGTKQTNLHSIEKQEEKNVENENTARENLDIDSETKRREDSDPRCPECGAKLVMSEGCMKCPEGCVSNC